MSRLALYVGVDSALTHTADALQIPLVCIAGPSNMQETGPASSRSVIVTSDVPCAPCSFVFRVPYHCHVSTHVCVRTLTAERILGACRSALQAPEDGRARVHFVIREIGSGNTAPR